MNKFSSALKIGSEESLSSNISVVKDIQQVEKPFAHAATLPSEDAPDDFDKNRLTDSEIKKLCEEKGCHCPPINEIRQKIAETPLYLREIFEATGRKKSPIVKQFKHWTVNIDKLGVTTEADSFKEAMLNTEDQLGLLWKAYVDCDKKELTKDALKFRKFLIRYADSNAEKNAISKILNLARDFKCCPNCGSQELGSTLANGSYCKSCSTPLRYIIRGEYFYDYLRTVYKEYCPTCRKITEVSSTGTCAECGNDV